MIRTLEEFKDRLPGFLESLVVNAKQWEDWGDHDEAQSLLEAAVSLETFCKTVTTLADVQTFMCNTPFVWPSGVRSQLAKLWFPGIYPPLYEIA